MTKQEIEKAFDEFDKSTAHPLRGNDLRIAKMAFAAGYRAALQRDGEPVAWLTRDKGTAHFVWSQKPSCICGNWCRHDWIDVADPIRRRTAAIIAGRDLEPGECVEVKGFIV